MSIEYDQQDFMNEYVNRQNRVISELTARNLLLETRLSMAEKKILELMGEDDEVMDAGTFGEEEQEKQQMGTVVQFKRSTSANAKPQASDLAAGEIAINTNDGKLFLEKDNGSIVEIAFGNNELILDDSVITTATLTTTQNTANQVVDSFSATTFRCVKYLIQVTSGSSYQVSEILSVHDGTTVYLTEYASMATGSDLATFDSDINSGNVRLLVSPTNAANIVKVTRTGVKA